MDAVKNKFQYDEIIKILRSITLYILPLSLCKREREGEGERERGREKKDYFYFLIKRKNRVLPRNSLS
jgi:hypothetical protein